MQQENVETTEQETDDEEYEEEQTAQSEEEKEVSCVYRADGTKSLGAILNECGMTMAEFFEKNNPEQIIIAAGEGAKASLSAFDYLIRTKTA